MPYSDKVLPATFALCLLTQKLKIIISQTRSLVHAWNIWSPKAFFLVLLTMLDGRGVATSQNTHLLQFGARHLQQNAK